MSSVVARRIAATPARSALETWSIIVDLLAPGSKNPARAELEGVAGCAAAAIASESTSEDAIVVQGKGPRVRIYCVFGDDALSGEGVNEDVLVGVPTEDDWELSIPVRSEDLEWTRSTLAAISSRVSARAKGEEPPKRANSSASRQTSSINLDEFLRS